MFREDYQKEISKIQPGKVFLDRLADKMLAVNADMEEGQEKKNKWISYAVFAASFLFVAMFGIGLSVWQPEYQDNKFGQQAGGAVEDSIKTEHIFDGASWYGEEDNPEAIYNVFLEKLQSDEEPVILQSETGKFSKEGRLDKKQSQRMMTWLLTAKYTDSSTHLKQYSLENAEDYLIEFADGVTVKYSIYGEKYFYSEEIGGIFLLGSIEE